MNTTDETKQLGGAIIKLEGFYFPGSHSNEWTVGAISLAAFRNTSWPNLDLGEIYYAAPTQAQALDAQTSPQFTPGNKAWSDINRRLSLKQAHLVGDIINAALKKAFHDNVIPADGDIKEWRQANGL